MKHKKVVTAVLVSSLAAVTLTFAGLSEARSL